LPKPQKKEEKKIHTNDTKQDNTLETITKNWSSICKEFKGKNAVFLANCKMDAYDGQLRIICPDIITKGSVEKQKNTIREIIEDKFTISPTITFIVQEGMIIKTPPSYQSLPTPMTKTQPTSPSPPPMYSPVEEPQGDINIPADWAEQESLIMTESMDDNDEVPF